MITQNPLIGRATKSLGNSTASKYFKKNVMRTKPTTQRQNSTTAQIQQNSFFRSSQTFVKNFLAILKIGYRNKQLQMPLFPWLIGRMMAIAPDNNNPHLTIVPQDCILSDGNQAPPPDVSVYSFSEGKFQISWTALDPMNPLYYSKILHVAWMKIDGSYYKMKPGNVCGPLVSSWTSVPTVEKEGDLIYVWLIWENSFTGEMSCQGPALVVELTE